MCGLVNISIIHMFCEWFKFKPRQLVTGEVRDRAHCGLGLDGGVLNAAR
jgi:hypothetical protein